MTGRSRAASAAIVLALATAATAGCAGGAKGTSGTQATTAAAVKGPAVVRPGGRVQFVASGFRPGDSVEVVLQPTARAACCAAHIPAAFPVRGDGTAKLSFTMPTTYQRCSTVISGRCKHIAWRPGERVTLTVTGYLQNARTRFVVSNPNA